MFRLVLITFLLAVTIAEATPKEIFLYGVVEFDPSHVVNINFSRPGQVTGLDVFPGQRLAKGHPLLEFTTDPAARLSYEQDLAALHLAEEDNKRTERLVKLQLATAAQYNAAQKALADAQGKMSVHEQLGDSIAKEKVVAPFDCVVSAVNISVGDRVQAGSSLIQIAEEGKVLAHMGLEPSKSLIVHSGMPIMLTQLFDDPVSLTASITDVAGRVNPQTFLTDVMVHLEPNSSWTPGTQVKGVIAYDD